MKVTVISNEGGFTDSVEVSEGTTVSVLFQKQLPNRRAQDYLIRVNRQPTGADQVLQAGDRVSFTPTKIEGA
jgi:hypothetical protein